MKKVSTVLVLVMALMLAVSAGARERHDSALFVVDVSDTISESGNVTEAKRIVREMNEKFPDYVQSSGLMEFGNFHNPQIEWLQPVENWDRGALDNDASRLEEGEGATPIGAAMCASNEGLEKSKGKTALILLTDGIDNGYTDPVEKVEKLKAKYGNDLCVFTIQLASDPDGGELLSDMVRAGGCGKTSTASGLRSDSQVQDLVDYIFPAEKVAPPPKCVDADQDGVCDDDDQCLGTPRGANVDYRGCWVLSNVRFDVNKWDIKPKYEQYLDNAAEVLKKNPGVTVIVEGHTDADGSDESNQNLSQKRAESVMNYLTSHGISQDKVTAKGYGESKPIADNTTPEGKAQNRRVELTIVE